ncbi:RICIN domain-containing protein [Streptomyces mirabilis]|uniref:RICIN domain-containing protein n=1 Tax=Streptomyces mirabilis TaxID=68239 RepID=UPI0036B8F4AA
MNRPNRSHPGQISTGQSGSRFNRRRHGLCLDVPSKSTAENRQLIQWTCNGGTNQQFFFDLVGSYTGSVYMLVAVHSGLNLGVLNSATTTGAAVVQLTGTGAASQKWTVG